MSALNPALKLVDNPDLREEHVCTEWTFEDYIDLRDGKECPDRGEVIIEGLLRAGEVMLIGSASKDGKSWLVGNLIWSTVQGSPWLGKQVKPGKVLLIDTELKRGELDYRNDEITKAMGYKPKRGDLTIVARRGKYFEIHGLRSQLEQSQTDWSQYSLIIIDSLYKCIPQGASENDNAAMGDLMNQLQGIGEVTGVPIVGVHHSPKGLQSKKAVLDVFAGAGAFGRSLDSAVVLRPHARPELTVVDFVVRSNVPQPSVSARFEWPKWEISNEEPSLKLQVSASEIRQKRLNEEADRIILEKLDFESWCSVSDLRAGTGMGNVRVTKSLNRLEQAATVETTQKTSRQTHKKMPVYRKLKQELA